MDREKATSKIGRAENELKAASGATARLEGAGCGYDTSQGKKRRSTEKEKSIGSLGSSKSNGNPAMRSPNRKKRKRK